MAESQIYYKQMEIGPMANFIYLLGDPKTHQAAVIDPAWDVTQIRKEAEQDGYEITHVLATHGHPDHVNGVEEMLNQTEAKLYMHPAEIPWMPGWKEAAVPTPDGEKLKIGELAITFIHTPGHSPGSQCLLCSGLLLSGDTLFIDSCGRTDLPGGNPEELYQSLTEKLMKLDDSLHLSPGHSYGHRPNETLGMQKKSNPCLRQKDLNSFLRLFSLG